MKEGASGTEVVAAGGEAGGLACQLIVIRSFDSMNLFSVSFDGRRTEKKTSMLCALSIDRQPSVRTMAGARRAG